MIRAAGAAGYAGPPRARSSAARPAHRVRPAPAAPRTMRAVLYVALFAVSVFVAGLLWLALLTLRAFRQVKQLGRTVADASTRIADATTALESVAPRDRPTPRR